MSTWSDKRLIISSSLVIPRTKFFRGNLAEHLCNVRVDLTKIFYFLLYELYKNNFYIIYILLTKMAIKNLNKFIVI